MGTEGLGLRGFFLFFLCPSSELVPIVPEPPLPSRQTMFSYCFTSQRLVPFKKNRNRLSYLESLTSTIILIYYLPEVHVQENK